MGRLPTTECTYLPTLLVFRCSALRVLLLHLCSPPARLLLPCGCCPRPPLVYLVVSVAAAACYFFCFLSSAALLLPACFALVGASRRLFPPPPLLLFVLLVSGCSALRVLSLLLSFPPDCWLFSCGCCPSPSSVCRSVLRSCFPSAAFLPACLALVGGSRRLPPPPPGACAVPCAVWCCRAALPFRRLVCGAVLPCSALRVVLWCLTLLCCGLLRAVRCLLWRLFVCCAALLVAAACCAVSLVVPFGWVVHGLVCCLVLVCDAWSVLCSVALGAVLCRAAARCATRCWVVVCCFVLLRSFAAAASFAAPSGAACRPGALCFAVLRFAVFPRAVCSVLSVFCRGVLVRAVVRRCALCCVCPGVSCCAFSVLSALCGAPALCWCACVVLFLWCVLLLAPGAVVRCCVLCRFLQSFVVQCCVWWPVVVCWWRASV